MNHGIRTLATLCAVNVLVVARAAEPMAVEAPVSGDSVARRLEAAPRGTTDSNLATAIAAKDSATVRKLIGQQVDLNGFNLAGATPLIAAIDAGYDEGFRWLLAAGANANKPDRAGASALFHAIEHDRPDYVAQLIEAGEDLAHGRTANESALGAAMQLWRPTIIQLLLQAGVDPLSEWRGMRLIQIAAIHGDGEMMQMLLAKGEDINRPTGGSGATPLIAAAQSGVANAVRVVLQFHPDVNARNRVGRTALMYAAERGQLSICQVLIAAGAYVNATASNRDSAYLVAGQRGHVAVLECLKQAGASAVPLRLPKRPRRGSAGSERVGFALGMAALELCYYGGSYSQWPDASRSPTAVLTELRAVHRVRDVADLRRQLDELLVRGHGPAASDLAGLSDAEFAQRLDAVLDDPVKVLALKQARLRTKDRPADDFAWRLCHHNYLATAGVTAGLLPADEAKERMLSAAKLLEAEYVSWEAIAPQVVAGLRTVETDGARIDLLATLLTNRDDPESPWTQHPFPKRRSAAQESDRSVPR